MSDFKVGLPDGTEVKHNFIKNSESAQSLLEKFYGKPGACCFCLCNEGASLKLSIKKRTNYFLAIYPNTSSLHHSSCPHYQKAPDVLTADDSLTKDARKEINGRVYISCNVGLTRRVKDEDKEPKEPAEAKEDDGTANDEDGEEKVQPRKIGLNTLLLKFWVDAQINQWVPAFQDKRYWGSIRSRILEGTKNVYINKLPMTKGLYLPQQWKQELSDRINAEKEQFFAQWRGEVNKDFIVIGELKDIEPSEHGYIVKIKNEKYPFYMNQELYEGMASSFKFPLSIYAGNQSAEHDAGKVMVIMSCNMPSKYITTRSIALMAVTAQYIPVLSHYELNLFNELVVQQRTFIRPAKTDLDEIQYPDAILLDTEKQTVMGVFDDNMEEYDAYCANKEMSLDSLDFPTWKWFTHQEDNIPTLPAICDAGN